MIQKKIFVLSDEDDGTTDEVLDWLSYYNYPFLRLNRTSEIHVKSIYIYDNVISGKFEVNGLNYNLSDFNAYWYRRGKLNLKETFPTFKDNLSLDQEVYMSSQREKETLIDLLHLYFESLHGIGSFHDNKTNKLINLHLANMCGLVTPSSLITKRKKDLLEFDKTNSPVITKPSEQGGISYEDDLIRTSGASEVVNKELMSDIPNTFFPSFFQGYVEKEFELRVFYLHEKCFCSAILSQLDEKTKIDFRNYNFDKPNRTPPFKLPQVVEEKIIKFMKKVKMDSGSLDFIVTPDGEFVFLEVNPVGQFFQVSYPCNYYLEKKVASYLLKSN